MYVAMACQHFAAGVLLATCGGNPQAFSAVPLVFRRAFGVKFVQDVGRLGL